MPVKPLTGRIGPLAALPIAALLLAFFFLPWVRMAPKKGSSEADEGNKVQSSGLQLTIGSVSLYEKGELATGEKAKRAEEDFKARPWYILGLIVPVAAILVGILGFTGIMPGRKAGMVLLILGVVGLVTVILASTVTYFDDMMTSMKKSVEKMPGITPEARDKAIKDIDANRDKAKEGFDKMFDMGGAAFLWVSLVLYVLVLGCGAVSLFMPAPGRPPLGAGAQAPPPPVM